MSRPVVVPAMRPDLPDLLFDDQTRRRLEQVADVDWSPVDDAGTTAARARLAGCDVLLTGWGSPRVDAAVLDAMPRLRLVAHAAGTVKHHLDEQVWRRGVAVSTAADANAVPVAEYTVAMVLLAGKRTFEAMRLYDERREQIDLVADFRDVGNYRRTVGIVGASRVGRQTLRLLAPYDLDLLVSDPYLDDEGARALGAELVDLDTLLRRSDIVSIHAPQLPSTHHLVDERRLRLMRHGATLINTARGSLVDTDALTAELRGGRLYAVLDVTDPEPLPPDSELFGLPNVVLTPHLAGAAGSEIFRLGAWAVDETLRFLADEPLRAPVTLEMLATMA